jgi:anaerobic magnesium-protoporphyrin IX monomethyl ester cyclase
MEKTVLLINPGHERKEEKKHLTPHPIHRDIPPVSLLTLGSYLVQKGIHVIIHDTHIDPDYTQTLQRYFQQHEVVLVGISTLIGGYIHNAIELGEIIKKIDPTVPIVWGGALVSSLPEKSLLQGNADFLILFEGELPLCLLAKAIMSKGDLEEIPNLGYRKDGKACFTKVDHCLERFDGMIRWDLLGEKINARQVPYLAYLFSSRGCPYHCTFCYHQTDSTGRVIKRYEAKSAQSVLEEIDLLHNQYGIRVFTFGDDNFLVDRSRVLDILDGLRKRNCYIEQCVGTFANLNPKVIQALSGICQTVICSIESASPRLLKKIRRPVDLPAVEPIVQSLSDHGVNTYHNFMFGLPGETDDDRKMAVDLAVRLKRINPYVRLIPFFFTPLPGTPIYHELEKEWNGGLEKSLWEWGDMEYSGNPSSYKYRPWLLREEQEFLNTLTTLFRELFVVNNSPMNEKQQRAIQRSPRLEYIFQNMDRIVYPPDQNPKYILDEILKKDGLL